MNARWASTAGSHGVGRPGERGHHAVAFALLDRPHAAVASDGLVEDLVVPGDREGHRRRSVLPALRRALDVSQQEGDRAGRKSEAGRIGAAHLVHQEAPDSGIDLTHDHGVSIGDLGHWDIPHLVEPHINPRGIADPVLVYRRGWCGRSPSRVTSLRWRLGVQVEQEQRIAS